MEFYQILILIIIGAVAIRISFKFDLNKHLENHAGESLPALNMSGLYRKSIKSQ